MALLLSSGCAAVPLAYAGDGSAPPPPMMIGDVLHRATEKEKDGAQVVIPESRLPVVTSAPAEKKKPAKKSIVADTPVVTERAAPVQKAEKKQADKKKTANLAEQKTTPAPALAATDKDVAPPAAAVQEKQTPTPRTAITPDDLVAPAQEKSPVKKDVTVAREKLAPPPAPDLPDTGQDPDDVSKLIDDVAAAMAAPDTIQQKKIERTKKISIEKTERVIDTLIKSAGAGAETLSITDALHDAYLSNPTLRAARAEVKAAFEKKPQAAAYWQPDVSAAVDVTYKGIKTDPGESEGALEKSASVALVQPLYRGGRTLAGVRGANAEVDAQLAILASTERLILFRTAQAYMDVLSAQANVGVNERNRDVIARQLRAAQDRFRLGDITRTDVSQSEFRLAQAEADLTTANGNLRAARAVFEQLVGRLPERLVLPRSTFQFPAQVDEAVKMAETQNSDVLMAEALRVAAEQNVKVALGALLPEIALKAGGSLTRDPVGLGYDDARAGQVGVSLSVPLYQGGALKSTVRQAKYTANQKFMNVLEARRAAREDAVRAWEGLAAARAEMTSREAQVRAAEVAQAGVHEEADVGERTILDALDADQAVRDAQIALINAKRNEIVAEYALASAIGLLVPDQIGITEQPLDTTRLGGKASGFTFGDADLDVETETETGR